MLTPTVEFARSLANPLRSSLRHRPTHPRPNMAHHPLLHPIPSCHIITQPPLPPPPRHAPSLTRPLQLLRGPHIIAHRPTQTQR
ncbi:hypothetical protein PanWU01x14_131660 [Parasponia andersonii]|uniref:Uncharacterized protein n=1 Tax=Parasponia andersonii TaxID=3476 RepID=A0A2P5CR63_PARAD|nr:hypothetical protein PanWU01x14_131660 [Parasponia andersonii]